MQMRFWSKSAKENPALDKGEEINRRAQELRRQASTGWAETETVIALGNALGQEVAAMVGRHANLSIEEVVDVAIDGVREQAYVAAGLSPHNEDAKELTEVEFKDLTKRIIKTATTKTLPNDAICATAKALGALICVTARRGDGSIEELVKVSQEAVAAYAQQAVAYMDLNLKDILEAKIASLEEMAGQLKGFSELKQSIAEDAKWAPENPELFRQKAREHKRDAIAALTAANTLKAILDQRTKAEQIALMRHYVLEFRQSASQNAKLSNSLADDDAQKAKVDDSGISDTFVVSTLNGILSDIPPDPA